MHKRLVGALVFVATSCWAVELTPDQQEECKVGAGCALVTRIEMEAEIRRAFEAGQKYQQHECAQFTGITRGL